jgi:hypothetical protein
MLSTCTPGKSISRAKKTSKYYQQVVRQPGDVCCTWDTSIVQNLIIVTASDPAPDTILQAGLMIRRLFGRRCKVLRDRDRTTAVC